MTKPGCARGGQFAVDSIPEDRGRMRRLVFLASCDRITLKRLTQSKRLQREEDQPCIE